MLARISAVTALLALAGVQLPAPPPTPSAKPPATPTVAAGGPAVPVSAKSPSNANYRIDATLDPRRRTITASETLTWRNLTANPTTVLQFHLYYNAWRDDRSSWMRETALAGFVRDVRPEDRASIDVTNLEVARQDVVSNLKSRTRFIAPDDGNGDDRTVMEVPLEAPVQPGETVNVHIEWTAKVPRTIARTGAVGDFFFIAQWFPKIGVLEDSGWNCHQFHATTEFYADFGVYDVGLTVPEGWTVGATGREQSRTDVAGGMTTHRYHAEDVHDFAWTTSPDFIERRERFEHPALPAVEMRLLLQPEHAGQAERHFDATRAALKYYGQWFGPYPYGYITIVDPAYQSGAGGMEYPTLFTAGTRWIVPRQGGSPEGVTVHEAGHQFWYGVIATNEFEHAWMDEGLNSFATQRVMDEAFAPTFYRNRYFGGFIPWVFTGLEITRAASGRMAVIRATGDDQSKASWRYWPPTAGAISYSKTAFWLHTLERMIGWDTLQRAMSTFYSRYAFKHPRPEDFFAVVDEVSGQDLTWFFDQVYRRSSTFDYAIETVRSESAGDKFRTSVVVRRLGDGLFPVDVRLNFEDGSEQRWRWDGRDRWKLFETERGAEAASAQVDPDRVLLLDVNATNNSYALNPRGAAAGRKWSLAWLIWLQDHLLTYGFFV